MRSIAKGWVVFVFLLAIRTAAADAAALSSYTTLSSWQAAASGTQTSITLPGTPGGDTEYSNNSLTASSVVFTSGYLADCGSSYSTCGSNTSTGWLIGYPGLGASLPASVFVGAAAGDFGAWFGNPPETVTVTATTVSGATLTVTITPGTGTAFLGFVANNSNDPIASISGLAGSSSNYTALIDFYYYSTAYPALSITNSSPLAAGMVGGAYSVTMIPSGGSGNYSWSAINLPPGLAIDPSTGVISGTPTVAGSYSDIVVTLNDTRSGLSTQSTYALTVSRQPTTTTLTPSANPATFGQNLTLTATITPATATGTVTFKDGGTTIGSPATVSNGMATLTTSALTVGSHTLTAVYSGDSNNLTSTSSGVTETVQNATTTSLTPSVNPATFGQSLTLTAAVTPNTATGTVTFKDGGTTIGSPATVSNGMATLTTSSLTVGSHTLTAVYSGDSNDMVSTSASVTESVENATTTTLTPSANPATFGQSLTLTAGITPNTATGTVTFKDGGTTIGSPATVSNGMATLTTSALTVGSHTLTAVYSGDSNDMVSTSASVTESVENATTTTLTPSANPATFSQSLTLTAAITPNTATGTVTFKDGGTTIGSPATVSNGMATLTTSVLTVGSHTLTAVYSGDSNDMTSTSASVTESVENATTTTLTPSANPATFSQSLTLTAAITPNTATGTVTFKDGGITIGSPATVLNGMATLTTSALTVGSHTLTAVYSGDSNDMTSTSASVTETVQNATVITLMSSANPATFSQGLTLTAAITPNTATGTVTFKDGSTTIGDPATIANGIAALSTNELAVGSHTLTALYSGDANNMPSTSTSLTETIRIGTTTTLTPSANPATFGSAVTLTAAVSPSAIGVVTFYDGAIVLGSASLSGGQAILSTIFPSAGTNKLTAFYSGSLSDAPSKSAVVTETVNAVPGNGFGLPGTAYAVGNSPQGIVTGDFNGDGISDLAVANSGTSDSGTISILPSGANGTFETQTTYNTGNNPVALAAGDFNGDGVSDIAVANSQDGTVSVLLSSGSGSFQNQAVYSVGNSPRSIAVGDFNGDGIADLAVTNNADNTLSVLLGVGDGTFQSQLVTETETGPALLASGDFNGDGITDLAVANNGTNTVSMLLGLGNGRFTESTTLTADTQPLSVITTDLNNDGNPDLVVGYSSGANVSVYLGNGNGTFAAKSDFPLGTDPSYLATGDFNGDGHADIVASNSANNEVVVLLGNGSGGFQSQAVYATGAAPQGVVVGSFHGNGRADIAVANSGDATVSVLTALEPTSTAITSSANPINFGQPLVLTASVTPSTATGPATFYDGETSLGTSSLSAGKAVLTISNLSVGQHQLTAVYGGNASEASSTSVALVQTLVYASLNITTMGLPSGTIGRTYTGTLTASGGSGSYSWSVSGIPGITVTASTGALGGSPTTAGTETLSVTVTDTVTSATASTLFTINVAYPPLQITNSLSSTGMVDQAYGPVQMTASGGSGRNYSWSGGGIPGVNVSASGVVSGTPTTPGNYTLTVSVADSTAHLTANVSYFVMIAAAPLTITSGAPGNGSQGVPYGPFTLTASGGTGSYTWSGSGTPPGVSVSAGGTVSGTPTSGGSFTIAVTVTDQASKTASQSYTISIGFGPVSISGPTSLGAFLPGGAIAASYTAAGGKSPYTFTASGLPGGLSLSPGGSLSGSAPSGPGSYGFTVTASDSESTPGTASTSVSFSVLGFTTGGSLPSGSTGTSYSASIAATGGTPPYSFSATSVPAGLSFANSGFISGTPTKAGTFSITVQLTDSAGLSVTGSFSVTIASGVQPVQVTGATLPNGSLQTAYSQALQANGGQPPFNWTMLGGTLPPGLALSPSGTIAGTPTTIGAYSFTARATDTTGGFASAAFSITINPSSLIITSGALPDGIATVPYPAQVLTASGGVAPYSFAITSGTLPAGLTFSNGQISGTTTTAGTSGFTVTVTDSMNNSTSSALSINVDPLTANVVLAQGSVSFSLSTGATALPSGASIPVRSSITSQVLGYSVSPASVPWLSVSSGGGSTPGSIGIALSSSALTLAPGTYTASITVTCTTTSVCSGTAPSFSVMLTVTAPAPQLSVNTSLLSFSATSSTATTMSQPVTIENIGGGTLAIDAVSVSSSWVNVSTPPATLSAGASSTLSVTVNPAGLTPDYYQSSITISTSAGSATVQVALLLAAAPTMTLNPAGTQFSAVQGVAPGGAAGSFLVSVSGGSTVNWTASVMAGSGNTNWLNLNTTSGSSTSASPGSVSYSINGTAAAALSAGSYYAGILVTSGDVVDTLVSYQVVLNIQAPAAAATLNPQPPGLIFIVPEGGSVPPQTVTVDTTTSTQYQASASTSSGGSWLAVSPGTSSTTPASPDTSTITVSPGTLTPGVYHGTVPYSPNAGSSLGVNVTMIVTGTAGTTPASAGRSTTTSFSPAQTSPGCTATQIVPTQTGLANNFAQPTSWPTPLTIQLVDDCGSAIANGQVVTTFTNGDPPLVLSAVGTASGVYSGTWTPRSSSSQVTITARATAPGFASAATISIQGVVKPNAAPILNQNGTVNIFVPTPGAPLAPGTIVQIYGANMSASALPSSTIPLPTSLANTSVLIGGIEAPLYYVSSGQINAQVPFELAPGKPYQVLVNANGALSTPVSIQMGLDEPGIAAFSSGEIIAQHADGSVITDNSPAMPGEYIVFYVAGMGATSQTVGSGQPSPYPAITLDQPVLTLNGAQVPIYFAGLTPTYVGLYQVNFQVPPNTPNGDLQLILTQSGGQSNSTILAVHN